MSSEDFAGRHFLFLQGPGGKFFAQLAKQLEAADVKTSRINVCAGDYFMWKPAANATSYRGSYHGWKDFLQSYLIANGVTDIIVFSDSRPYHRVAKQLAETLDINFFVFENGYLRPDWITLELGGVNGNSRFPRIRFEIEALPAPPEPDYYQLDRPTRLQSYWPDVKFHFANTLFAPPVPVLPAASHGIAAVGTLIGHGLKWLQWPLRARRSLKELENLWRSGKPYYLFALQLEHDYQLIEHSPFENMRQAAARVIESFAKNAPEDSVLLVKNHPLDNNLVSRRRETTILARQHAAVADRVKFIETGPNPQILDNARGMITVNSTLGTSRAVPQGAGVCHGRAVYDIDGLTHQLGLDAFWRNPTPPDDALFVHFRRALVSEQCQIRGRFVTAQGRSMAAQNCAERILGTPFVEAVRTRLKGEGVSSESGPSDPTSRRMLLPDIQATARDNGQPLRQCFR